MSNLPPWYSEGIPRVSSIVDFVFPFKWDDVNLNVWAWLDKAGNPTEQDARLAYSSDTPYLALASIYLREAQDVWTFIHRQLELFLEWEDLEDKEELYELHQEEIENWLTFLSEYNPNNTETEKYIREPQDRYQWSIDLVADLDWLGRTIVDWKTYWIARKRFWIPYSANYKKPYDKLKKARLQLSLYAYALGNIDTICVVELTNGEYHLHILEKYTDKELETILTNFELSKDINKILDLL